MATVLEVLREIYLARVELTDLREQIKRAPLQLKAKENEVAKIKARIAAEKEEAKKVRVEADSRELSLKQAESRIRDLKGKLNVAESNKEYQVIQDEIKRIAGENDKLQDEILEKITLEEEMRATVKASEAELSLAETEFAKYKEVVDYKIEKLKGQVGILSDQIKKLEPQLGDSQGDYQRMVAAKGDMGLADCVNGTCQGCFSEQPPQSWQELLNGRPFKCRTCGALMFKSA
ncbi:hypothetical protein K2X85_04050 [bacterium]|nr:hypothetical protein [bacterium]